jgi:metal-responsive CopG/Arc/MetJ family transcriptional regulator
MPSKKPQILLVVDEDLLVRIDDFRFDNRINSRSEAVRRLIEKGLNAADPSPKSKKKGERS